MMLNSISKTVIISVDRGGGVDLKNIYPERSCNMKPEATQFFLWMFQSPGQECGMDVLQKTLAHRKLVR